MAETKPRELFHQAHYNALAKEIREHFVTAWNPNESFVTNVELEIRQRDKANLQRAVITDFALSLCKRFKQDNPRFDPIKFLSACSPDNDLYPLAELYEEEND